MVETPLLICSLVNLTVNNSLLINRPSILIVLFGILYFGYVI